MLCCGCFVSSSSVLVHCAENESIQEWRAHFDQRQKAGAWLIPGRISWLFHPWLIHQTSVTKKNIVFNHSHNPRSVPKWDLSPNRWGYCRLSESSRSRNMAPAIQFLFQTAVRIQTCWLDDALSMLGALIFADRHGQVDHFIP